MESNQHPGTMEVYPRHQAGEKSSRGTGQATEASFNHSREVPQIVWCTHFTQPDHKVLGLRAKYPQQRIPVLFFLGRNEVGTTVHTDEEMQEWKLDVIQGDPLRVLQEQEPHLRYPKEYAIAMFYAVVTNQRTNGKAFTWTRWGKYVFQDYGSLYITVRCHKCQYPRQLSLYTLITAPPSLPLLSCAEMRVPCRTRQENPLRVVRWPHVGMSSAAIPSPILETHSGKGSARMSSPITSRTPQHSPAELGRTNPEKEEAKTLMERETLVRQGRATGGTSTTNGNPILPLLDVTTTSKDTVSRAFEGLSSGAQLALLDGKQAAVDADRSEG